MPRVTITVPEKNAQPYRFQLDRQVVTLGRGSENDIAIECGSVSVNHAEMHRIKGGYELRDAGSTNGIKLDGVRKDVIPLRNGATVKLGDVAFDFVLNEEELAALAREKPDLESPITREPEESPKSSAADKVAKQREAYATTTTSGIGFGAIVMFLILAAAAFFAGMAVRHQKETGRSLIQDMQNKFAIRQTIEVPAPAGATPPAEAPVPPAK
ncbi:MAG: FHA domain-containing protein [Luteolibacter sp.]